MVALKLPVALQIAPNKAHDARTPARLAVAHLGSDGLTHARHARHDSARWQYFGGIARLSPRIRRLKTP